MGFIVAIDGTAGSGKGTITKIIAEKVKFFGKISQNVVDNRQDLVQN